MKNQKIRPFLGQSEFQAEYSLAQELPYWDFLDETDGNCVVLADGSLVRGYKLAGVSVETMDTEQVNTFTSQLRSILNTFPDGIDVQFIVDVNSNYADRISEHENLKGNNSLISWVADNRIQLLKEDLENNRLQRPSLYLFIYSRVNTISDGAKSFFEKPKKVSKHTPGRA